MNKVIIEINVPAANEKFDVFVPKTSKIYEVIELVSEMFSSILEGKYKKTSDAVLCDAASGKVLDINKSVYELNLINGSKLILI